MNQLTTLLFDEWLHGNIIGSLVAAARGVDWGMRFAIFCWLLWKVRCSTVLDGDYVERESMLDRGNVDASFCAYCRALGVCDGLRHAWEVGFRSIELETDNKEVASICNGSSSTLTRSVLVSMIYKLQQRSWEV
ncbi:hypothetical protein V6N11_040850 [Hibiscus sabdariffa]|uniref:RNase H type-1 domain-containing protein n=1 Tax=Hibiscus sabdariffa TaxID=183260 RepID=A0ABR2RJB8_9ROSI